MNKKIFLNDDYVSLHELTDLYLELRDDGKGVDSSKTYILEMLKNNKMELKIDFPTIKDFKDLKMIGLDMDFINNYFDFNEKEMLLAESVYEKKSKTLGMVKKFSFAEVMKEELYKSVFFGDIDSIEYAIKNYDGFFENVIVKYLNKKGVLEGSMEGFINYIDKRKHDFAEFVKDNYHDKNSGFVIAKDKDDKEMTIRDVLMVSGTEVIRKSLGEDTHVLLLAKRILDIVKMTDQDELNNVKFIPMAGRSNHGKDYILENIKKEVKENNNRKKFKGLVGIGEKETPSIIGFPDVRNINEAILVTTIEELKTNKEKLITYLNKLTTNVYYDLDSYDNSFTMEIKDLPGQHIMNDYRDSFKSVVISSFGIANKGNKQTMEENISKPEKKAIKKHLIIVKKEVEFKAKNYKNITRKKLLENIYKEYKEVIKKRLSRFIIDEKENEEYNNIIENEIKTLEKNLLFILSKTKEYIEEPSTLEEFNKNTQTIINILKKYGNTRSNPYHHSEGFIDRLESIYNKKEIEEMTIINNLFMDPYKGKSKVQKKSKKQMR